MLLKRMLIGFLPISIAAPAVFSQTAPVQKKPNVVFILADKVGYGDLGSYGGWPRSSLQTVQKIMNHTFELNRNKLALTDSETNGSANQSLKDDQQQEMVAIGGCGGVFFVPSRQINDYYQAHGLVSAGLIILFVLILIGALFYNWFMP